MKNLSASFNAIHYPRLQLPARLFVISALLFMLTAKVNAQGCTVNSGLNVTTCSSSATLVGNINGTATGSPSWSLVSGPAGATPVITSPGSLTTTVTGMTIPGTYVYRIAQPCQLGGTATQDVTVVANPEPPGFAVSGAFEECNNFSAVHTLTASPLPPGWTGRWRALDFGGNSLNSFFTFSNINSTVTTVQLTNPDPAAYCAGFFCNFGWEITSPNGLCKYQKLVAGYFYPDLSRFDYEHADRTICGPQQINYNSLSCGFWNLYLPGSAFTVTTLTSPPGATGSLFSNGTNASGQIRVFGFSVPGVYTFNITLSITTPSGALCGGTKTFGPYKVTVLTPPPPAPAFTNSAPYFCIGAAPASLISAYTVADPTIITTTSVSLQPAGSDPVIISESGAGTTTRTLTVTPNTNWKPGQYRFRINSKNAADPAGTCSRNDQIILNVYDNIPPVSTSVPNTSACIPANSTTATAIITLPNAGTGYLGGFTADFNGYWRIAKLTGPGGPSAFALNSLSSGSQFGIGGLTAGVYTFQVEPWGNLIQEFNCTGSAAPTTFTVTIYNQPGANAGPNQNVICIQQHQLAANLPIPPSIGTWTQVSGPSPMQFTDIHDPDASVAIRTNHANQGTYVFRWTISDPNGTCPAVSSDVTITSSIRCNYLPVNLIAFSAVPKNGTSLLSWITASEINTRQFIIEWSADGINWKTAGEVPARGEMSNTTYNFTHSLPGQGVNYYRLRIVDADGKFSYSTIVSVRFDRTGSVEVLPNPVRDNLYIYNLKNGDRLMLVDAAGITVRSALSTGTNTTLDVLSLSPGLYILRVLRNQTEQVQQVKIIKQ